MTTDGAHGSRQARVLLERLAELDPGGVRLARGLHLVTAIALGVAVGSLLATRGVPLLDQLFGDWVRSHVPAYAGMFTAPNLQFTIAAITSVVASHIVLLVPPASRPAELRAAGQIAVVAVGYLLVVGLAAPGAWGYGALPVHLLWIAVIGGGLYIRRYGPAGTRIGVALIVLSLFVVLLDPVRGPGLWLPVAGLAGALIGFFVRFATWRPSAARVFRVQRDRFLDAAATDLAEIAEALGRGARPGSGIRALRRRWSSVATAYEVASAEAPDLAEGQAREVAAAYRLLLACESIADALAEIDAPALATPFVRGRIRDALAALSHRVAHTAQGRPAHDKELADGLHAARGSLITDTQIGTTDKLQLMRLLTGVVRVAVSLDTVGARIEPAEAVPPKSAATGAAASLGRRLLIQGIVAASITTGLNYAFHFEHAYWATLTVALVLNGTVGETVNRTLRRAGGTAVGVLAAIGLSPLIGNAPAVELALILLCVMGAIMVIDVRYDIAAGLIGFTVVTGLHMLEGVGPSVMLARAYETLIGAAVALAVAWTVAPSFAGDRVGTEVGAFLDRCRTAFRMAAERPVLGVDHTAPLEAEAATIRAELPSLKAERWLGRGGGAALNEVTILMEALVSYLGLFERASAVAAKIDVSADARAVMMELDHQVETGFAAVLDADQPAPALDDILARFVKVVPLDGAVPVDEAFALVERFYYGRKIGQTLSEFKAAWERT